MEIRAEKIILIKESDKRNLIKLAGYFSGLVSVITLFISLFLVMSLNPIYDFRIHMISLLGIIKGKEFFNTGIILTSILHFSFINSLRIHFKKIKEDSFIITTAFLFGILFCFSEMGVGIFPANIQFGFIHRKVAFLFFHFSLLMTFLFSILLIHHPETKHIAYLGFGSFLLIFLFMYEHGAFLEWIMALGLWSWIGIVSGYMIYLNYKHKKVE
ncbi:MAG: hypothetical protein ACFFDF_01020 [Candidatus Odinarchaeota archaeon]